MRPGAAGEGAVPVSFPVAGWYRFRLRADGVRCAVKIFFGPPADPVTGELLDRSPRWQCLVNGEYFDDFNRIWPACARDPLTEEEYNFLIAKHQWALKHAPDSGLANPRRRNDLLQSPLEF